MKLSPDEQIRLMDVFEKVPGARVGRGWIDNMGTWAISEFKTFVTLTRRDGTIAEHRLKNDPGFLEDVE